MPSRPLCPQQGGRNDTVEAVVGGWGSMEWHEKNSGSLIDLAKTGI